MRLLDLRKNLDSFKRDFTEPLNQLLKILIIFLSLSINHSMAREQIIISLVQEDVQSRTIEVSKKLFKELSKITNFSIKLVILPSKRATQMLRSHRIHAELFRLESYQKIVKNVIRVPASKITVPIYVYSANVYFPVKGWSSLQPYSMINIRGYVYPTALLPNKKFIGADSVKQAFQALAAKRAEIFTTNQSTASIALNSPEFKNSKIRQLTPPVGEIKFYTFFSSKYPKIAEQYNQALQTLKTNGTLAKIFSDRS